MFPKRLFALWILCFKEILCSSTIERFEITTDTVNFDTGGDTAIFELNWNDNQYTCNITASAASTTYTCDSGSWETSSITPDSGAPFFMRISYVSATPFQIASINVVSDDIATGTYYTIDEFCISPGMQCTMDYVLTNGEDSTSNCDQFDSKISYSAVAIGGLTQFELLYVTFRNAIEYYVNSNLEGSVGPPLLTTIGYTTGNPGSGVSSNNHSVNAIQWDQTYYQCDTIPATDQDTAYECTPSSLQCPGTTSNFWFSLDTDNDASFGFIVQTFTVTDETGRKYYVNDFCVDSVDYTGADVTGNTDCSSLVTNGRVADQIFLIRVLPQWRTIAGYYDECIFEYPDDSVTAPLAATFDVTTDRETPLAAGFGSFVPLDCIATAAPSDAPSSDPTDAPSLAPSDAPSLAPSSTPTQPPSLAPSLVPSNTPTQPPSDAPSLAPSSTPTQPPSLVPSDAPSLAPSSAPSLAPSLAPSDAPSLVPSTIPTQPPSIVPSLAPSSIPTQPPSLLPSIAPSITPTVRPTDQPTSAKPSPPPTPSPTNEPTPSPTKYPSVAPTEAQEDTEIVTKTHIFWAILLLAILLLCCCLCWGFVCWRRSKDDTDEHKKKAAPIAAAVSYSVRQEPVVTTNTYGAYDTGVINTQPSNYDDDNHYLANYKESSSSSSSNDDQKDIELQQTGGVKKQYTIDGVTTGGTGNDNALDMLADGHDGGKTGKYTPKDDQIDNLQTQEYNV